jgi:hypothetical protein
MPIAASSKFIKDRKDENYDQERRPVSVEHGRRRKATAADGYAKPHLMTATLTGEYPHANVPLVSK